MFNRYYKGVRKCIREVDRAISKGAILSGEEALDYYFKVSLVYRAELKSVLRSKEYRIGLFMAHCFECVERVIVRGYNNNSALRSMGSINFMAGILLGVRSCFVLSDDENGVFKFIVDDLSDYSEEREICIHNKESLVEALLSFAEDLIIHSKSCKGYHDFLRYYLRDRLTEVKDGISPEVYVNSENVVRLYSEIYQGV